MLGGCWGSEDRQHRPLSMTSTMSMPSTMSRKPTPLGGEASSELTPAGGGEGGFLTSLTLLTAMTLDGIDGGRC